MKLLLFFFVMTISTSRQQDSTETLSETLERLIKQAKQASYSENNENDHIQKNNSRVIFLKPPEGLEKSEKDSEAKVPNTQIDDDNLVSITDILHALGLQESKSEDKNTNSLKEITYNVEGNTNSHTTNAGNTEVQKLLELISRTGASAADANTDINLLHKYPEIIIDKIVYHGNKNQAKKLDENKAVTKKTQDNQAAKNQDSLKISEELKSLLEELQKIKTESNVEMDTHRSSLKTLPQTTYPQDVIQHPCGALVQYINPCKSVMSNKITQYQNLGRSGGPGLDANMQLNMWEAQNARANALMIISRAEKLRSIQFLTSLINSMTSRFAYRPLYGYT